MKTISTLMLSSLLLLAAPSIAAGYTLHIFGNANMDDVITRRISPPSKR
jgi:hypothetical protein